MIEDMGLKIIALIEVPLIGTTSIPDFIKIYQAVQKLLVGHTHTHTHTERERERERLTSNLISLLPFFENRLKWRSERHGG
jgi:hypothetical protein